MLGTLSDRWIAERHASGSWVAVRYVPSRIPSRSVDREVDGRWWKGELLPTFHDTLAQCEARCEELNNA